jgi:RNA polymerase sigma-70 factor (ECF subfamily)
VPGPSTSELHEAGRRAWPDVAVEAARFARFLDERCPDDAARAACHGADLYLACACADGDAVALRRFEERHLSQVASFLARMAPTDAFVDEVRQLVRERLFVGEQRRILAYGGQGPLAGWLRVIALRIAVDLRRHWTERRRDDEPPAADAAATAVDPELDFIKASYRDAFRSALEAALAGLSDEQRNLLRLHFIDALTLDELAALFRVHRATIARRVAAAREAILERCRHLLGERLALDASEFESLLRVVRSQIDLSLRRLL